jgi:hypothetical protein
MATPRKTTTTGRLLDVALKESRRYAKRRLDLKLASSGYTKKDVQAAVKRGGALKWIAAAALTRLATRSLPGALMVGGAVIAKALFDRRKSAAGEAPAPEAVDDPAA